MDKTFALDKLTELIDDLEFFPGGVTVARVEKLRTAMDQLSEEEISIAKLVYVTPGGGGRVNQYGEAKKRKDLCFKIGSGGKYTGSKTRNNPGYQIWLNWSEE